MRLRQLLLGVILLCAGCSRQSLHVKHMVTPGYPVRAQVENIQGIVKLNIEIGADGKVVWVKGSGAHPILVEAAENNVRNWVFGPFPPVAEFPIYHTVSFEYSLQGPPLLVAIQPTVRTNLPDGVKIQARLFESDQRWERLPGPRGVASKKPSEK